MLDAEEVAGNALCFALEMFRRWKPQVETQDGSNDGEDAYVRLAFTTVKFELLHARYGRQFAKTHNSGYVDALDRRDKSDVLSVPIVDFRHAYIDEREVFARLLDRLRLIAECLHDGETQFR